MSTLSVLSQDLRNRIGEQATADDSGFWSDAEIAYYLNRAQNVVADDLTDQDTPWASTRPWRLHTLGGVSEYMLPRDFLQIRSVTHFRSDGRKCQLRPANVRSMQNNDIESDTTDFYSFYQIDGEIDSTFVTEGIATGGSTTTMVDTDPLVDLAGVRIGMTIFNLDDNEASAIVTNVDISTGTVTFKDWAGGSRDIFSAGDRYRISSAERTREVMLVYPKLASHEPLATEGTADNIVVEVDTEIADVTVNLGSLNPAWHSETSVRWAITPVSNVNQVVAEGNIHDPKLGANPADATRNFILRAGTTYQIHGFGGYLSSVELLAQSTDYLEIQYVPYPRPMLNERSVCELRAYQLESMLRKAKRYAMEKRDPASMYLIQLDGEYEQSIQQCKETQANRQEGGQRYVDENMRDVPYVDPNNMARAYGDYWELV